jgi:hypothetical protein
MSYPKALGHTLISLLISLSMGMIIISCVLHYLFIVLATYHKLQLKFDRQNAQLIARHYLATDLHSTEHVVICKPHIPECAKFFQRNFKADTNILILNQAQDLSYSLRRSAIPSAQHKNSYALYRDDTQHNAVALIEDLVNFRIAFKRLENNLNAVLINLSFSDTTEMELIFVPQNLKPAL